MNRRDLFKRLAGAVAAVGMPAIAAEAHEAPIEPKRALVVISTERYLTEDGRRNILEAWKNVTFGTPWQGARAVVLDAGMKLEVHDASRFEAL